MRPRTHLTDLQAATLVARLEGGAAQAAQSGIEQSFRADPVYDRGPMHRDAVRDDQWAVVRGPAAIDANVLTLALLIADEAARSDIEIYAPEVACDGRTWYDTSIEALQAKYVDPSMTESIPRSLRYLELRGKVTRNVAARHLVRF